MDKPKYAFSLRKKMVLGITLLALVTYGMSALFIFVLREYLLSILPINEIQFVVVTLLLGIIWSGILGFFAVTLITKRIQKLHAAVQLAAQGDLSHQLDVNQSDDEIRGLCVAFNQMIENIRHMVKDISAHFEQTNANVLSLRQASDESAEQADAISRTIEEIAGGAERSASAVQMTVEAVDQVAEMAEKVNHHAEQSKNWANEMVTTLNNSAEVVRSLVAGMQDLAEGSQASIEVVRRLEKNAQEINEITNLVADIAEQTNLLALNASIEAARAGEHGRGFVVVAEEVRKLADESSQAVQNINQLIGYMQTEVDNVVRQIEAQVEVTTRESERGLATNTALEEITASVDQVFQAIEEIAGLANTQKESMVKTVDQAQEVAAVAQETSAGAQEVAATTQQQTQLMNNIASISESLRKEAELLEEKIKQFII